MFSNAQNLLCLNVKAKVLSVAPVWLALAGIFATSPSAVAADVTSPLSKRVAASYGKIPLSFEANQGQTDPQVKFLSHGNGYSLFLTSNAAIFSSSAAGKGATPSVVSMELLGARRDAQVSGAEQLPGVANYFIGNDPKKWHTGVSTFGQVKYQGIYPGVDAVFYGNQRQLEYDFVVAPGADPKQISLGLTGAKPRLDADGNVVLKLDDGNLVLKKPVVYQGSGAQKKIIDAQYTLADNKVCFRFGKYDPSQALVIDPVLSYLTYLGGTGLDVIGNWNGEGIGQTGLGGTQTQAIAVDSSGNLVVVGHTTSLNFPLQAPYQSQNNVTAPSSVNPTVNDGNPTAFVTKLNPTGSALIYSTYLGGNSSVGGVYDSAFAVAVDSGGNAYVTGVTGSSNFPITAGAYQTICAPALENGVLHSGCTGSSNNAFLSKFSPTGDLVYSTFLGGGAQSYGISVAVDSNGRAYIAGFSEDSCSTGDASDPEQCFPETANALLPESLYNQASYPAGVFVSQAGAAFVSVFDAAGANLLYSTLYGDPNPSTTNPDGNNPVYGRGVAVDPSFNFYLTGWTADPNIRTTPGAFQPTYNYYRVGYENNYRAVVAKFSPVTGLATGASLTYGTYLGGTGGPGPIQNDGQEQPAGIATDAEGNAYVTGSTSSYDFPITEGLTFDQANSNGNPVSFLTKINPSGSGLVWSTLVGSNNTSSIGPPRVDSQNNVYTTGLAYVGYPEVNPVQPVPSPGYGEAGLFVTEFDPTGSTLLFSTLIYSPSVGGAVNPAGVDVDSAGHIYFAGSTTAPDLPVTAGVFQPALNGTAGCTTSRSCLPDGFIGKISPENIIQGPLLFVPMTPCRVADTRNATSPFGGPSITGGTSRSFVVPSSACAVPSTAIAYSINVTAIPHAALGYLTVWPTGVAQPLVSLLNSDGRVKANAAIVQAGTGGAISVYATDATDLVLDINGYFVPSTSTSALAFYPVTPCRVADTRNPSGLLGGPSLVGNTNGQGRAFPILSSACNIPSSAQAYSLNFTAVPQAGLGYLSAYPAGQAWPGVSTLNSPGTVVANAAIVPAGTGGAIDVLGSNNTDVVIDINGYFAPVGTAAGGQSLFTVTPCRVLDTRSSSDAFNGELPVNVTGSPCGIPSSAEAFVLNATVVPTGGLGYLSLWPENEAQPVVSTLNADDGVIASDMAIVPTINGSIDAFSSNSTQLILDISGCFAPSTQ